MEQSTSLDEKVEAARPATVAEALNARTADQTAHLTPRVDGEAAGLQERAAARQPKLTPREPPGLDPEIMAARMRDRNRPNAPQPPPVRPAAVSDPEREAVRLKEERIRANFRAMMAADVAAHGPHGANPRVPMQAVRQGFRRRPSWTDPPPNKDGSSPVPPGCIPQWVTTESTTGMEPRPSMATVNDYLSYGYTYVRDDEGEPIVTTNGVLMSATPEVWAERQADKEPTRPFSMRDLEGKPGPRQSTSSRYGQHTVAVTTEMPEHGRGYEYEQVPITADQ